MSDRARNAYEDWNVADVQARQAEAVLGKTWESYFDGKGAPPTEELIHEVSRLRAAANERLSAAVAAIDAKAKGREHPR
jgi:hypothetical protein